MHRATLVYIVMAVIAVAGLWVILAVGGHLVPPRDFAGVWSVAPGANGTADGASDFGPSVRVEQSGRFFQLQFANGVLLKLRMADPTSAFDPRPAAVPLTGAGVTGTITPLDPGTDAAVLSLQSPSVRGTWNLRRQSRAFAGETSPAGPAHPTLR